MPETEQHTPGPLEAVPWQAKWEPIEDESGNTMLWATISDSLGRQLCALDFGYAGETDEREAMSVLHALAATPDLLEALEAMLAGPNEAVSLDAAYADMDDGERAIIDQARAAVAKVKGE
ncbi:MAG: hypothetical protein ABIG68_01135 [Acidobacteriota bacterium]